MNIAIIATYWKSEERDQMHQSTLSAGRDLSLIVLTLEIAVLGLVPGIVLYYSTRWLSGFLPEVAPFLRSITTGVRTVGQQGKAIMLKIAMPFVLLRSASTGMNNAASVILRRR